MPAHRFYQPDLRSLAPAPGVILHIDGDEARHALRVKRLRIGEVVELIDGAGIVVTAKLAEVLEGGGSGGGGGRKSHHRDAVCSLRVHECRDVPRLTPIVHVHSATPKGSRVEEMIDGLSQVGAASWSPLQSARGVVDPSENKLDRLQRVAIESCKQCGRAWKLDLDPARDLNGILASRVALVIADASGTPFSSTDSPSEVHLLIGPEGGWTSEELAAACTAGAHVRRFGPHVMRIETAAVVAAGTLMSGARSSRNA